MYKEDFVEFRDILNDMTNYIIDEKGEEVISEKHQKDFNKESDFNTETVESESSESFTDISFEDI